MHLGLGWWQLEVGQNAAHGVQCSSAVLCHRLVQPGLLLFPPHAARGAGCALAPRIRAWEYKREHATASAPPAWIPPDFEMGFLVCCECAECEGRSKATYHVRGVAASLTEWCRGGGCWGSACMPLMPLRRSGGGVLRAPHRISAAFAPPTMTVFHRSSTIRAPHPCRRQRPTRSSTGFRNGNPRRVRGPLRIGTTVAHVSSEVRSRSALMPSRQERRKAERDAAKRAPGQAGAGGSGGAAAARANVNMNPVGDWTTQAEDPGVLFRALGRR